MRMLRASCAAAVVVAACGSPTPATPKPPPLEVKTYAPLGFKTDAKAAHQAVILGTDARDGSTLLPLPATARTLFVDVMFAKPDGAGVSPIKLATAPNRDGSVQVDLGEDPGSTGVQWRANVWTAAFVTATTLDKDLTDFTFSAIPGSKFDGAYASAVMTAGALASITGAPIDATATMTGTINTDGTVGPVPSIVERVVAAIDSGKRRIGYPIGMRLAKSAKTGAVVDLEALAKERGAEAIAIADIHGAYHLLTGARLPEPLAVPAADMAFDAEASAAIDRLYKQWHQRLAAEWAAILQLESAGRLPKTLASLRDTSKRHAKAAESFHARGMPGAAYTRMVAAWEQAASANQIYDVLAKVQTNKVAAAVARVAAVEQLDTRLAATFEAIGAAAPSTIGDYLQMLAACRAALRAWTFDAMATEARTAAQTQLETLSGLSAAELGSEQVAERVVTSVTPGMLFANRAAAELMVAREQLELRAGSQVAYKASLDGVHRLAVSLGTAGTAGIEYVATLGSDAMTDPDYRVAGASAKLHATDGLPTQLKATWGERSLAWTLLSLAAGQLAYFHATELADRYHSIGAHEQALVPVLARAEAAARAHARAARIATGAIPVQAKLAFELASVGKLGSTADKLEALSRFREASAYAQTAVLLARN